MKKRYMVLLGIVLLSLGAVLVFPYFDRRFSILRYVEDEEEKGIPAGDPTNAYDYFYAPEHSFGVDVLKTVNWTFFRNLFNSHTDWILEYKRFIYSEWTDGSQYLTIERSWNESGYWKFNLILDVPVNVYSARFTFGVDLPVLQYVNMSGHNVFLNYTANATETYSCMFNWSDIAEIPGIIITHGVQNGIFWFRFRRDNIPAGHYEFDPQFGSTSTGNSNRQLCYGTTARKIADDFLASEDGIGDNMSFYYRFKLNLEATDFCLVRLAVYTRAGTNNPTSLLGYTEPINITGTSSYGWYKANFENGFAPEIVSGTRYYLAIATIATNVSSAEGFYTCGVTGNDYVYDDDTGLEDPWNDEIRFASYNLTGILCNYTAGGGEIERVNTQIFNRWFLGGNESSRENFQVFNKWFLGGNETSRVDTEIFNRWFVGANESYRVNAEIFNRWFVGANESIPINITISDEYPINGSMNASLYTVIYITIEDLFGASMNVTYEGSDDDGATWFYLGSTNEVSNGTYGSWFNDSILFKKYYWRVSVEDDLGNYHNETYHFNTTITTGNASVTMIGSAEMIERSDTNTLLALFWAIPAVLLAALISRSGGKKKND